MKKRILLSLLFVVSLLLTGCSLIESLNKPVFKSGELDGTYVMTVDRPETEFTEAYTIDYLKLTITGKTGTISGVSNDYLLKCGQWATMRKSLNQDPGEFPTAEWEEPDVIIDPIQYDRFDYEWNLRFNCKYISGGETQNWATASEDKKTITLWEPDSGSFKDMVFKKR